MKFSVEWLFKILQHSMQQKLSKRENPILFQSRITDALFKAKDLIQIEGADGTPPEQVDMTAYTMLTGQSDFTPDRARCQIKYSCADN